MNGSQRSNFPSRHHLHGVDPLITGKGSQGGRNRILAFEQNPYGFLAQA